MFGKAPTKMSGLFGAAVSAGAKWTGAGQLGAFCAKAQNKQAKILKKFSIHYKKKIKNEAGQKKWFLKIF